MAGPALIFDVDGTLAETEELHRQAFNEAFSAHGLDWRWPQALYGELLSVTGGKERILHYARAHRPGEPPPSPEQVAAIHAHKTRAYTAGVEAGAVTLRPGVARLIAEARRAGFRLAIATTTSRPNIEALLRRALPEVRFEAVVAGDEVPSKKPAPDVYEAVLREFGCGPACCAAVEDSANGVRSAYAAGIPVIATPGVYTAGDDFAGAFSVVSDLGEPEAPHRLIAGQGWRGGVVTAAELLDRIRSGERQPAAVP
jgi:HAD superfamily hydrolase (TIGR01509 family)